MERHWHIENLMQDESSLSIFCNIQGFLIIYFAFLIAKFTILAWSLILVFECSFNILLCIKEPLYVLGRNLFLNFIALSFYANYQFCMQKTKTLIE